MPRRDRRQRTIVANASSSAARGYARGGRIEQLQEIWSAEGCASATSLRRTYCHAQMSFRALATARLLTEYETMPPFSPSDTAEAVPSRRERQSAGSPFGMTTHHRPPWTSTL
jgi:hypothetical protein